MRFQQSITHIAWLNSQLGRFVIDVLKPSSVNELIAKANYIFQPVVGRKNQYFVSIRYGKAFVSYRIEDDTLIVTGFYLQNYEYDDDNNPIFITGDKPADIGKINRLINNGIKI